MKTNEQHSKEKNEESTIQEIDILAVLEQMGINRSSWPCDLFPPSQQ